MFNLQTGADHVALRVATASDLIPRVRAVHVHKQDSHQLIVPSCRRRTETVPTSLQGWPSQLDVESHSCAPSGKPQPAEATYADWKKALTAQHTPTPAVTKTFVVNLAR